VKKEEIKSLQREIKSLKGQLREANKIIDKMRKEKGKSE
jgi:hypothetical protein